MPEPSAPASPSSVSTVPPQARCPYLAGRPPHGSYHMGPSGVNVCYARPREEKPYGGVSKETQAARCFCGTEPYERCPDYERAHAREIAFPVFTGSAPAQPITAEERAPQRRVRRERVKRRHRRSPLQQWLKENGRNTFICASWTILALAVFSLILRSM
jgi:hypothetical protein